MGAVPRYQNLLRQKRHTFLGDPQFLVFLVETIFKSHSRYTDYPY